MHRNVQTLDLLASALQLAPDARAEFERVADRGRVRTRRNGQVGVASKGMLDCRRT